MSWFVYHLLPLSHPDRIEFLYRTPSQRCWVAAICIHDPQLALACAGGIEDDLAAIGRPTGVFVEARAIGQLTQILTVWADRIDLFVARVIADKGDRLAIGDQAAS